METITMTASDATDLSTSSTDTDGHQTISVVQLAIPSQSQVSVPSSLTDASEEDIGPEEDSIESRKRRELLARRPSYRKIFNDLSSPTITVTKIEEESESEKEDEINVATGSIGATQVLPGSGAIQLSDSGGSPGGSASGLQTLTMTNAAVSTASSTSSSTPTIVQYTQGPDGQFFIPAGSVQAYQISTPTSLPQTVVMTAGGNVIPSAAHLSEEATRKRELRLLKNRDAAKECRRKKKEYVKCLENRVAVLENQNKTLIEELKTLKELYCQKDS